MFCAGLGGVPSLAMEVAIVDVEVRALGHIEPKKLPHRVLPLLLLESEWPEVFPVPLLFSVCINCKLAVLLLLDGRLKLLGRIKICCALGMDGMGVLSFDLDLNPCAIVRDDGAVRFSRSTTLSFFEGMSHPTILLASLPACTVDSLLGRFLALAPADDRTEPRCCEKLLMLGGDCERRLREEVLDGGIGSLLGQAGCVRAGRNIDSKKIRRLATVLSLLIMTVLIGIGESSGLYRSFNGL